MANLFIVNLTYIADMALVEPLLKSHLDFVDSCYQSGIFLASGPKVPRDGGIILAKHENRAELESLLNQDPFLIEKVAKVEIVEFVPRRVTEGLETIIPSQNI